MRLLCFLACFHWGEGRDCCFTNTHGAHTTNPRAKNTSAQALVYTPHPLLSSAVMSGMSGGASNVSMRARADVSGLIAVATHDGVGDLVAAGWGEGCCCTEKRRGCVRARVFGWANVNFFFLFGGESIESRICVFTLCTFVTSLPLYFPSLVLSSVVDQSCSQIGASTTQTAPTPR